MKMLKYFYTVCLISLIFSLQSVAQNTKILVRPGERCFSKEQYKNAYPYFEQVLKTDPDNLNALYKSGVCNLHRFSKEQALINLEKVYAKDSTYNKYLYFWLGRAYHLNYDFEKAFIFYNKFQQKISKNNIQYKEVERYKYQLTCGADYISNPSNYKVQNVGAAINSSYSEHSPVLSQNDTLLLFTSRRANVIDTKEEYDGEPFENIFYSHKLDSVTWSAPESFQLNTSGHDASIQLYDNDTKLFIYSYLHGGDIYTTENKNGTWSTPVSLEEINSIDFEADVFLTADGKTLYYASNHFKKNGDLDIYYLTKNTDGTWSKPQALSSTINTDEDEDAPYISADGRTMYFSSRGHTSMGGYDIFKSTLDTATGAWSKPVNLGYPVNTPDEDLYFILSHTSEKGYLSSYRTGGYGEKDIYEVIAIEDAVIKGQLVDKNNSPVKRDGLIVQIIPLETASKNAKSTQATVLNDGTFDVSALSDNNYSVFVLDGRDTIARDTLHIALIGEKNRAVKYNCVIPDKQVNESTAPVTADTTVTTPVAAQKIQQTFYFAVNISTVGPSTKAELRELVSILEKNPNATISISGHADGSGPESVNTTLAQKRAANVKEYLESKGILASRIKVASYGSTKPVATNDTEAGRSKNRRVEIVVE
ncbi:OmpA family protein [Cytophaga aurantiaca]|uniref:OmpA family protein n=1 Tax=Cytophaga aurantiaca TaxID=29530 RepID=UPI0003A96829|nr:OmpA family protein [Cytophaga aurantiaca]